MNSIKHKSPSLVDSAMAIYTIAQGELEAWEAQFVALRKMVSIREIELKGNIG